MSIVEILLLFVIATVASFIGSLQAGMLNTAVVAHTVQRGTLAGKCMAIGGSLPELLYAGIAYLFANVVLEKLGLGRMGIALTFGVVLIGMGLWYLFLFKPRFDPTKQERKASSLRRGLLLGLFNPQLLLFWCGVVIALHGYGFKNQGMLGTLAFGLGAFAGAVILLLQLVKLGEHAAVRLPPERSLLLFRWVGAALVTSGLLGLLRIVL